MVLPYINMNPPEVKTRSLKSQQSRYYWYHFKDKIIKLKHSTLNNLSKSTQKIKYQSQAFRQQNSIVSWAIQTPLRNLLIGMDPSEPELYISVSFGKTEKKTPPWKTSLHGCLFSSLWSAAHLRNFYVEIKSWSVPFGTACSCNCPVYPTTGCSAERLI